jgi:hypothetical protein
MRLKPLIPAKNTSLRAAVRAVDSKVRPDFRRAIVCAVLAFTLDGATSSFGGVHAATLDRRLAAYGTAAGFVVFGLAATRSAASELSRVSLSRAGAAAPMLLIAALQTGRARGVHRSLNLQGRKRIPDRHSEDLFVRVRAERFLSASQGSAEGDEWLSTVEQATRLTQQRPASAVGRCRLPLYGLVFARRGVVTWREERLQALILGRWR